MSMTTQSISPLWETMPLQKTAPAAEKPAAGSLFADIGAFYALQLAFACRRSYLGLYFR